MIEINTKIIQELVKNPRISISELARILNIKREKVESDLSVLESSKTIVQYSSNLNPSKFGFDTWLVYFKFRILDSEKEQELIKIFEKEKKIIRAIKLSGDFDFLIHIIAKNNSEFYESLNILNSDIEKLDLIIKKIEYSNPNKFIKVESSQIKLSKEDKLIIDELKQNARASIADISSKTKLTRRIVSYRLSELIRNSIIQFHIRFDFEKLSVKRSKILIKLKSIIDTKLIEVLKSNSAVKHITPLIGSYDLEVGVEAESYEQILELANIIENSSEFVEHKYIIILKQEVK